MLLVIHVLPPTESQSFGAARLQDEGNNGDKCQQTARYDQVDDVVKRSTSHVKRKRDA